MAEGHYSHVGQKRQRRSHHEYTIALFCVLGVELVAMKAMLDEVHEDLPVNSANTYIFGSLSNHNVVIVVVSEPGNTHSGIVAARFREDFPSIQLGVVVGVGGGAPGKDGDDDIRLGDVVVSESSSESPAVIQFDRGKQYDTGGLKISGHLNKPPSDLVALVKKLKTQHRLHGSKILSIVKTMFKTYPGMELEYGAPTLDQDNLYQAHFEHIGGADCAKCPIKNTVERIHHDHDRPSVHYGTVGSSNCVIKSATERDRLRKSQKVICFEMESAGIIDQLPCLVVRGICDYADSHKNKRWQPYAAALAAAYVKELLQGSLPRRMPQLIGPTQPIVYHPKKEQITYEVLLASLVFPRMDARLRNISRPLSDTCGWLKERDEFRSWMNQKRRHIHHGFLWIKGKPGSGKSTLMKMLYTSEIQKKSEYDTVSYFFNARAPGHLEKSSLGLYRSLAYQLLVACSKAQALFLDQFSSKEFKGEIEDWTVEELKSFLIDLVSDCLERPLVVIIDALDEGDESDIRQLVGFLEDLANAAPDFDNTLRICLSSRHYPHITIKYGVEITLEKQLGHDQDIEKYIYQKLRYDRGSNMDELRKEIRIKSDGVFLWVVLVIPILNEAYDRGEQFSTTTMSRCLKDIPQELDNLFAKILTKSEHDLGDCLTLLQWMLYSKESLTLTQLYLAVASNSHSPRFGISDTSPERIRRCILDTSRGLIEVGKGASPVIQLIHETISEFLKKHGLAQIDPTISDNVEGESYDKLKLCCYRYIEKCTLTVTDNKNMSQAGNEKQRSMMDSTFPFLKYAAMNMFEHAETAQSLGKSQKEWMNRLSAPEGGFTRWIFVHNAFQPVLLRRYTPKASVLYVIADVGLPSLLKLQLAEGSIDKVSSERYGTALQAACARCQLEAIQLLLKGGADVNAVAGEFDTAILTTMGSKSTSLDQNLKPILQLLLDAGADVNMKVPNRRHFKLPLSVAAESGLDSVVSQLLDAGARVDALNGQHGSALQAAIISGSQEIVLLLMKRGANVNIQGGHYGTPLQAASYYGHEQIVRLLIKHGAKVNTQGGHFGNALQAASSYGNERIVRLLIDSRANINTQGGYFGTALQAASHCANGEIVKFLIEQGARINVQGGRYGNALQAASHFGHKEIIQILVRNGAKVNVQGGYFGSALQAASFCDDEEIIQLLIEYGAYVNAQGGYYGNALQAACVNRREKVIRVLISHGADVNAKGGHYGNALQAACYQGNSNEQIVRFLIDRGAGVNAQGGHYGNALQAACSGGRESIVRLLLSRGADVKARGGYYKNALDAALRSGHGTLSQYLLAAGAHQ